MKNIISNFIGGLAGAIALNIVHQAVQQIDRDAPRVDLLGEEALSKSLAAAGVQPPTGDKLFAATLAADITGNAAYYSLIGAAKDRHLLGAGALCGIVAGIGALTLPKPLGLHDAPVTRTTKTKILTVAWYAFGGIVAGSVIKALRAKN